VLFLLALTLHESGGPHQFRQAKGAKNRTLAEPVAEPGERLDTLPLEGAAKGFRAIPQGGEPQVAVRSGIGRS
jgi:hypothetical protein